MEQVRILFRKLFLMDRYFQVDKTVVRIDREGKMYAYPKYIDNYTREAYEGYDWVSDFLMKEEGINAVEISKTKALKLLEEWHVHM